MAFYLLAPQRPLPPGTAFRPSPSTTRLANHVNAPFPRRRLLEAIYQSVPAALAGLLFAVTVKLCNRLAGDDSAFSPLNLLNWTLAVVSIEQIYPGELGLDAFSAMLGALAVYVAWRQRLREGRIYHATLRREQNTTTLDQAGSEQTL